LIKSSVPSTSISNQSAQKSSVLPISADPAKRSFFRFNSSPASSGNSSINFNNYPNSYSTMGQTGSNVKRSQSDIQTFLDKEKDKFIEKFENPIKQNSRLEDFDLIRTIGTGSFGKNKFFK
jgi:hypothetical protein